MKAKRIKGMIFICGCGAQFTMDFVFTDLAAIRETACKNCGAMYRFERIDRYTVIPLKKEA